MPQPLSHTTITTTTEQGVRAYTPTSLKLYDTLVLGFVSPYGWRCSAAKLVAFFNRNIAQASQSQSQPAFSEQPPEQHVPHAPTRILDIGVGTGYFPAHAPLGKGTQLVLVDLNANCLDVAAEVIRRAHPPETGCQTTVKVIGDFLAQGDEEGSLFAKGALPEAEGKSRKGFDAISLMFLLHCLPGPPSRKAEALVRMGTLLRPGGVLLGATILGKGVSRNPLAMLVLYLNNYLGIFDNHGDDAVSFLQPLREAFHDVRYEVVGCMLLFEARDPKTSAAE